MKSAAASRTARSKKARMSLRRKCGPTLASRSRHTGHTYCCDPPSQIQSPVDKKLPGDRILESESPLLHAGTQLVFIYESWNIYPNFPDSTPVKGCARNGSARLCWGVALRASPLVSYEQSCESSGVRCFTSPTTACLGIRFQPSDIARCIKNASAGVELQTVGLTSLQRPRGERSWTMHCAHRPAVGSSVC